GDFVRVVPLLADLPAEEDELVALPKGERAELLAHAELGHHPPGEIGRLLDVVRSAGGRVAEDHLLRRVAPKEPGDLILELRLALEISIFGRESHRVSEGHAPADDRDLVDRVALG